MKTGSRPVEITVAGELPGFEYGGCRGVFLNLGLAVLLQRQQGGPHSESAVFPGAVRGLEVNGGDAGIVFGEALLHQAPEVVRQLGEDAGLAEVVATGLVEGGAFPNFLADGKDRTVDVVQGDKFIPKHLKGGAIGDASYGEIFHGMYSFLYSVSCSPSASSSTPSR